MTWTSSTSWVRPSVLAFVFALGASACSEAASPAPPGADPADALVWGYPLVVSQRTMQSIGAIVGVNALFNQGALSSAGLRIIVSPNQDTLYSAAVVDLRSEPMVLTVSSVSERYWTYQFLDPWTNAFHYIGTRATSGEGGTFVITPPGWTGTVPAGAVIVPSPTPRMFLLGRYLVRDDADIAAVKALDRRLEPLSTVMGTKAPAPPPPLDPAPGIPQETGTQGAAFFDELGDALAENPATTAQDRALLERFASLGIGPGKHPASDGSAEARAALDSGVSEGMARVLASASGAATQVNGWTVHRDIGVYGDDPLLRAAVANYLWGAHVPEEALYAASSASAKGEPYTGAKRYKLHFDAGQRPPVDPSKGFWSLALYGPDHFFVDNPLKRYAIGDRTPGLAENPDGSLDLYVQADPPAGHEANWLPAPPGAFLLMLRLYLPLGSALENKYTYPPVVPAE